MVDLPTINWLDGVWQPDLFFFFGSQICFSVMASLILTQLVDILVSLGSALTLIIAQTLGVIREPLDICGVLLSHNASFTSSSMCPKALQTLHI